MKERFDRGLSGPFDVVLNAGVLFALDLATPSQCFAFGVEDFGD